MKSLLDALKENTKKPYHMPGHKRRSFAPGLPYDIDITEIEGFDNLHRMQGILKDMSIRASRLYRSLFAFPLVNGSTGGILAGIYTLTRENKNILIARNCHKSVYNAAHLLDLNPTYIMPESQTPGIMGKVCAQEVEKALKGSNIGTVVITSPTYEGVVSDAEAIYNVCKKYGARLFIDCAHGAHFGFGAFPESVVPYCDMCVMSLHKTLPALTQTALLHICSERVSGGDVSDALSLFETSSPSYVLLASIDECIRYIEENKKDFDTLCSTLSYFYEQSVALENMRVCPTDDPGKIIIAAADGYLLADKLRQHDIEVEMASAGFVLAMATVADKLNDLQILLRALYRIDKTLPPYEEQVSTLPAIPKTADYSGEGEFIPLEKCCGRISKEYIWAYPPGVPIITPGEIFDREIIKYLKEKKHLHSTNGKYPEIYVKKGL